MTTTSSTRTAAQQRRWFVHLGLIVVFVAALATVGHVLFGFPIGVHSILGLAFAALIVAHFAQRRHRVHGLLAQLRRPPSWVRAAGRLAWSDLVLTFLFVNLIVSGVVDYLAHANGVWLHLGVIPAIRWHALSAILLLVYLIVHVARRARRLRTSRVS
jgi:hypothetical protein